MAMDRVRRRLDAGGVLLLDGPTGTELERRGAEMSASAWCGPASVENYDLLRRIHADYLAAGCDIVTANTYASSRLMLEAAGIGDRVREVNAAAIRAAREAVDAADHPAVVAGSLSHVIPFRPGTSDTMEDGGPSLERVRAAFRELVEIQKQEGCDLILLEMMYQPERVPLAIEAAMESGLPVWVGFSVRPGDDGTLLSHTPHADVPFARMLDMLPERGVEAAGVMHTRAGLIRPALEELRARFDGPLMAYPDSGHFEAPHWNFRDVMSTKDFRGYADDWAAQGVQIVGGCCGLSLDHIRAISHLRR